MQKEHVVALIDNVFISEVLQDLSIFNYYYKVSEEMIRALGKKCILKRTQMISGRSARGFLVGRASGKRVWRKERMSQKERLVVLLEQTGGR